MVQSSFARKGGKSRRQDALSSLVLEGVKEDLTKGLPKLLHDLKGALGAGVVTKIDTDADVLDGVPMIHFFDDNGKEHALPLSRRQNGHGSSQCEPADSFAVRRFSRPLRNSTTGQGAGETDAQFFPSPDLSESPVYCDARECRVVGGNCDIPAGRRLLE